MDRIEALGQSLSQITLYDIKSAYNQAKNVVLNISEMEGKVREATNDDPWGASSTLMQEIAQGTFSFQYFNEIMPAIYSRFMEKEARQWRQIYKSLQLLEYLIKHGSERVVDDARAHVSTIKMLRNFHYIDDKGKDEGINIRNRAREIVELIADVDKIRAERRKAKANKHKYVGTGNDGFSGMSFSSGGGGGRYGGFGSDGLSGGYSGNNDYYGAGSSGNTSFRDDTRRSGFDEYDAGDDEDIDRRPVGTKSQRASTTRKTSLSTSPTATKAKAPAPAIDDLIGWGADEAFATTSAPAPVPAPAASNGFGANKALPAVATPVGIDDDDFADFQAAPVQAANASTPASVPLMATSAAAPAKPSLVDLLGSTPSMQPQAPVQPFHVQPSALLQQQSTFGISTPIGGVGMHRPSPSLSSQPGFQSSQFSSPSMQPQTFFNNSPAVTSRPTAAPTQNFAPSQVKTSGGTFDDLWSMSLGTSAAKPAVGGTAGKSIKDLEREKAMAGLWGDKSSKPSAATQQKQQTSNDTFGLGPQSSNSPGDDLLL